MAVGAWKRSEAEEKVKAHESLQRIDEDIANGDDVFINEQLREITRKPVRGNNTNNDIGEWYIDTTNQDWNCKEQTLNWAYMQEIGGDQSSATGLSS